VKVYKRPLPIKVRDNEPWDTTFDILGVIALFTNGALVVFSSHEFDHCTIVEKIVIFFGIEHAVFFLRVLVKILLPECPRDVRILMLKQEHIIRKHLDCIDEEDHEIRQHALQDRYMPMEIADRDEDDDEGDF